MNIFRKVKRMAGKITENKTLKEWQSRLETAKSAYADERSQIKHLEGLYNGDRSINPNPNIGKNVSKKATNIRNIIYELVESQVDSSIPMPKVRALHGEDDELAKRIERMLENKVKTCGLTILNDAMERVTPTIGGDYFYVQWDVNKSRHSEIGDVKVTEVHPKKLIPQPGVTNFDNMDYFFIQEVMTKKGVKRAYGVDVEDAENDSPELTGEIPDADTNSDIVTVTTAYYQNDEGGIGCYIWCDYIELLNIKDYQKRQLDHCKKCGAVMQNGVCPECGCKKSKKMPLEYEEVADGIDVEVSGGGEKHVDPFDIQNEPVLDDEGNPVYDEYGQPRITARKIKKKIPYYKPSVYPVILRRNTTIQDHLLGGSDAKAIEDQQDTIKKLGTKINEKLINGGSFVTLPRGVGVELNEKELKVIRVDNAAQVQLIQTINLQPNIQYDQSMLETNYQWAKSTLGITDSYQGKYDASATSGTAKQFSINQAAGRLESKRTLKNDAFGKLYELMFKFWLAYSDQTTEITFTDSSGDAVYDELNRKDFLRLDANGEFYWDDEFIFETDPTSTLMANREAIWNQVDLKLQSGAFGPLDDPRTRITYWTLMKANGYPNAGMALDVVKKQYEELQEQQAQMTGDIPGQIGEEDEMPFMQNGDENQVERDSPQGPEVLQQTEPRMSVSYLS